jgi:putative membrane protein
MRAHLRIAFGKSPMIAAGNTLMNGSGAQFDATDCMTKHTIIMAISAAFACAPLSWAVDKAVKAAGGALDDRDRKFLTEAAQGGMFEVSAGKLTDDHTSNPAIKQLGGMLEKDHAKANDELKQIAQQRGATLPAEIDRKHGDIIHKLANESGDKFDKTFVGELDKAHKDDITLFEKESAETQDPQLREFANRTLPVLRSHQDHLRAEGGTK